MKTQWKLRNFLVVGIQLIFAGIGVCKHVSSFLNEVGECYSYFGSNDPNSRVLSCIEKYIEKSNSAKHDNWSKSDPEDFVRHENFPALCEALSEGPSLVTISVLNRYLVGEGSHRRLFSSVRINIQADSIRDLSEHICEALIIERLPLGIFVDPFELEHLLRRNVFKDAAVFGDTDLELPTILSNQSLVEIHVDVDANALKRQNGLKIEIEIPLHARYPALVENGYARVEFGPPNIFVRCSVEVMSKNESCLLMPEGGDRTESITNALVWQVPSGMKSHEGIVSLVTFISASLSAVAIVATSLCYSDIAAHGNLRRSDIN